jgi:hypothetical protein
VSEFSQVLWSLLCKIKNNKNCHITPFDTKRTRFSFSFFGNFYFWLFRSQLVHSNKDHRPVEKTRKCPLVSLFDMLLTIGKGLGTWWWCSSKCSLIFLFDMLLVIGKGLWTWWWRSSKCPPFFLIWYVLLTIGKGLGTWWWCSSKCPPFFLIWYVLLAIGKGLGTWWWCSNKCSPLFLIWYACCDKKERVWELDFK